MPSCTSMATKGIKNVSMRIEGSKDIDRFNRAGRAFSLAVFNIEEDNRLKLEQYL